MDYKEKRFEEDIEQWLLTYGGYSKGDQKSYDRKKALDLLKLVEFIQTTQPKAWERYVDTYKADAESKLFKRFTEEVELNGLLHVLRQGITDHGIKLHVAAFRHESTLNPEVVKNYEANILTVTRQFKYSTANENSIDMVLSLNGIPIVALELKDQYTGQNVDNAKKQFMYNRDPRELCFQFNKRFLVYFAVDLDEVEMTTKLERGNTFFLPFNQGSNGSGKVGGAGNPENPEGYPVSYLWEQVLKKDSLMDLLKRYLHLDQEVETIVKNGKETRKRKEKLIFPRYHQLDSVRYLLADARAKGSGHNYLIQHSAGSGKSNSIAWLSYGLASLHDENNQHIFSSVIVVTDRKVLDNQLQRTISSFDHTRGLIETIGDNKTSQDLKQAINDGKRIIVTTLQKFPFIYQEIDEVKGKRFAVIVDEAHSSQTGKSASKLREGLTDTEEALREYERIESAEEREAEDYEDKIVNELLAHGRQKNLSFFAFTATPKQKTLEVFGKKTPEGSFQAHHIYSMKQAIEEGFILDVLKNYMTYKTCFKIAKETEDNPSLPSSVATRTIKNYQSLHPYNLQQKTAIIIEQFREVTKKKIGGRAKAMVVTASRLHAVRYYHEFKNYIERKGYKDVDILVAFSGMVKDRGEEFTEEKLNQRKDGSTIKEDQLRHDFHGDDFNVLIVAEKYQTGFDEPLLHTMFVDKKLDGVKAVQTLSRLNRIYPGKEDTFILDFVNTGDDIQEAFKPYYEATILDEAININLIYDTKSALRQYQLYDEEDIEEFVKIYYKRGKQTETDLGRMTSVLKPVVGRYDELDEDERFGFKRIARNFVRWYAYITQIARMFDKELHKEYVFVSYLEKLLPKVSPNPVDLEGKLKLEFYKLLPTFEGDLSFAPVGEEQLIYNPKSINTESSPEAEELLEIIIKRINERYTGAFTESDRVIIETIYNRGIKNNKEMEQFAKQNDIEVFSNSIFPQVFKSISQELYIESVEAFTKLFEDKEFYQSVMQEMAYQAYRELS